MFLRILLLMLPMAIFASWEDVAVKTLDVLISARTNNEENFKKSLSEVANRSAAEFEKSSDSYMLNLPNFINQHATTPQKRTQLYALASDVSEKLKPAIKSINQIAQKHINSMDSQTSKQIMSGKILLSHYMQNNAFDELYEAILPYVKTISKDSKFIENFKNLTGQDLGENFVSEFTSALLNDGFENIKLQETNFRKSSEAILNVIKSIQ